MKLNPNCVREVLLAVESCSFDERISLGALTNRLPDFSEEDISYTCLKLEEGGYLDLVKVPMLHMPLPEIAAIKGMTYFGHEFLESIRESSNWDKVKAIAQKAGTFSLSALGSIAQEVIQASILSALQPPP